MSAYLSSLLILLVSIGVGASARAETLVLANGDEITGEIIERTDDHVVIEHPQLGSLRLELDKLADETDEPPDPGLFGTRFLRGWTRHIDLGVNGAQSDTHSASVAFGSKLAYEDPRTRWSFDGRYFYNSSDDDDDGDNNATATLERNWLRLDSRWYGALAARYQFDEFQAWKQRATLFAGPGLHLVDTERHRLDVALGPAFTREFGESDTNKAEATLSLTYDWKISELQSFDFANQLFSQISPDAGDWRNFTTLAWSLRLTERPSLSLNLGLQNEYESDPEPSDNSNDFKYFLTLGMDL